MGLKTLPFTQSSKVFFFFSAFDYCQGNKAFSREDQNIVAKSKIVLKNTSNKNRSSYWGRVGEGQLDPLEDALILSRHQGRVN